MHLLKDDLPRLARAIVGEELPSSRIESNYRNYTVEVAIGVYRNNYSGNLHDTLAGAFPVIAQLVGNDFFKLLARRYIEQHPSRSGNLHHYGADMAGLIAGFEPAQGLAYLPDVAMLEWACHCAYFADDAATLDIASLGQVPPERHAELILHIHPACHLVPSVYPIAAIWHAHQPGACSEFHIDLNSGSSNVLVSRQKDVVMVGELSTPDSAWLQRIQTGTSLGDATAAVQESHADFDLRSCLLNLVTQGVISGFGLREFK